jgi:hypothetical protein
MARFVSEGIEKLSGALNENSPLAKQELHSHLSAIRMFPTEDGEGWYYIAEGTWDLLGTDPYAPDIRGSRRRAYSGGCGGWI